MVTDVSIFFEIWIALGVVILVSGHLKSYELDDMNVFAFWGFVIITAPIVLGYHLLGSTKEYLEEVVYYAELRRRKSQDKTNNDI